MSGFVRNEAVLSGKVARAGTEPEVRRYRTALAALTDAEQFPALHQAIASGALEDDDELGGEFDHGLGASSTASTRSSARSVGTR